MAWDSFYKDTNEKELNKDSTFEWYVSTKEVIPTITPFLKIEDKIFVMGCGNSTLSEEIYSLGFKNIINVDIVPKVIEVMKERCEQYKEMKWMVADVLNLKDLIADSSIDVIIDKGTVDSIMCSLDFEKSVSSVKSEARRILKEGGLWIICSHSRDCMENLSPEEENWDSLDNDLEIEAFTSAYLYILKCRKKS